MTIHAADQSQALFCRRWHVIEEVDLVRLITGHAQIERLCARLEAAADTLPELPAGAELDAICDALRTALPSEERFFESLFRRELVTPLARAVLRRIHGRRAAYAVQAQDLVVALRPGQGDRAVHCETLGYMLRCFFEGCRQAMTFEELAILELAGERLTPAARGMLVYRLAAG